MLINQYSLVLLPISLTVLTIYNRAESPVIAQIDVSHPSKNARVGFNLQMVQILRTTNRAQQAYYFEQNKFAANPEELEKSGFVLPNRDNYKLPIETKDNAAFIYGIPQQEYGTYKQWSGSSWEDTKEPLYAYVSAIAYSPKTSTFQSILCASETVGKQELVAPKIVGNKFTCPQNTEEIP